MSREKVAQFKARFKDPVVREKIKNAIAYRQTRKVPYEEILEYLVQTFGEPPMPEAPDTRPVRAASRLTIEDSTSQSDGLNPEVESPALSPPDGLNSTCNNVVVEDGGLNSTSENSTSQPDGLNCEVSGHNAGLNPGFGRSTCHNAGLNSTSLDSTLQSDGLNSTSQTDTRKDDGLNHCLPVREPTPAEIAAVMADLQNLQRVELNHFGEGVVLELPYGKERAGPLKESPADAPSRSDDRPLEGRAEDSPNEPPTPEQGKTTQDTSMRSESGPSPTRAVFSSLVLTALIGLVSYYLIQATESLYGTPIASLLVAIPLAIVFFVHQPAPRYIALVLFLGADLWSIHTLRLRDVAVVEESSLSSNPEYQRLKSQHEQLRVEREALDPATKSRARGRKAAEMKTAADRMGQIEASSINDKRAEADQSTADVTLAVRALLLIANALLAHALLFYTDRMDFDAMLRWAFRK